VDCGNLNEAEITVFGLIVSRCESPEILQLVEAPFNTVAHRVDIAVNVDSDFRFFRIGITVAVRFASMLCLI
jgi:hypothetical protein